MENRGGSKNCVPKSQKCPKLLLSSCKLGHGTALIFIIRCVKCMLAIKKDEVFLTITFLCSESSRESPHQVGPGAKPSLQDLFSLVLQKRTSVRRTERQGEGNSNEKQRTLKQHIQRAPSGQ